MANGNAIYGFLDESNERASTKIFTADPADGTAFVTIRTEAVQLQVLMELLTLGRLSKFSLVTDRDDISNVLPTNPFAQRESKWFVPFIDSVTGEPGHFTIPNAKLDGGLKQSGNELADLTAQAWIDFIAAVEQNMFRASKLGSGLYVIGQPYHVGRNT